MSLQTDLIFVRALQQSREVAALVDDRIYMTAIPRPEENAVNEPLPYIVVSFDGIQPTEQTKDDDFDQDTDTVMIGIEMAAANRPRLAELADVVRKAIKDYFEMLAGTDPSELDEADAEMLPLFPSYAQPSGGQVYYDEDKPCHWLVLSYACEVNAFTDEYEDQRSEL